jgi:hypothetical protein
LLNNSDVRYEVFTVMYMKIISVLLNMAPCSLVNL